MTLPTCLESELAKTSSRKHREAYDGMPASYNEIPVHNISAYERNLYVGVQVKYLLILNIRNYTDKEINEHKHLW
jgi:hypothetical protein